MKRLLSYVAVALLIAVTVTILYALRIEPFESIALRFNDINFALQNKKISPKIVFVAVDEPSVNRFGRWPWRRSILAQGIKKLHKADVVLMDMIFSETTTPQEDMALAKALSSLNASVCGFFLRKNATQDITDEELELLSDSSLDLLQSQIGMSHMPDFIAAPHAEMNSAVIMQGCTMNGSFTAIPAADHLLRSYPVAVYFQGTLYPSLALQGLRLLYNADITKVDEHHLRLASRTIEVDAEGTVMLNYYHRSQYKSVSFLDLFEGRIAEEYFKNKIVILGITEVGAGDIASTPIGNIPGPLLHYTFLSNFLNDELITQPRWAVYVLIFIMAFVAPFALLFIRSVLQRTVVNIIFYLLVYLLVRMLFVRYNIYIDLFYPLLAFVLSLIATEVVAFNLQQKDEKFLRDAFSSYLSEELLQELVKNPKALALGGEKKELTILFSDIRSFTTMSESMSPEALIRVLNRYFTPMTQAVLETKGMLDKYIGDAIMAFFNAPVDVPDHADKACECALMMMQRLKKLNKELRRDAITPIKIGIGINTAEVIVGNMGSDTRFNYTVIGDGVNLASRVEGLTKHYGVGIIITEFTKERLTQPFLYRMIEPVRVKGKNEAVVLYELMEKSEQNKELKALYDKALGYYMKAQRQKAKALFEEICKKYGDPLSEYFLKNIDSNREWGVHVMRTK